MPSQTPMPLRLRKFWHCLPFILLIGCTLSGCQQFVIISYLLHGPPSIEPDFDAETGESMISPDTKVAVVCFAPTELQWKFPQIDDQVATYVAHRLSQNGIDTIHPDYVKAWTDQNPDWEKAAEIGKAFNTDYVIEIELAAFSLHEGTSTTLYRGQTEAYVHAIKVDADGYGDRLFSKQIDFTFPTRVPRPADQQSLGDFQKEYLSRLSEMIGWCFYDRFHGDMIGWSN